MTHSKKSTIPDASYQEMSEESYWVDSLHEEHSSAPEEGQIRKYGGRKFKILRTEDNQSNGMQAMAVSPVDKNGNPDKSQVVIAYAGTNSADGKDIHTDIDTVVFGKTKFRESQGSNPIYKDAGTPEIPAQSVTALKFAKEIEDKYPDADISTTGHSLGEYLALLTSAENKWKNVGFNGADPAGILTAEALQWVKDNPGMLTNYRNRYDKINLNGNGTGAEVLIDMDIGELGIFDAHDMKHWEFDKNGKIIIPDNVFNQTALGQQMSRESLETYVTTLLKLSDLEVMFKASGGGLSTSEKIYLEDHKALAVVEAAASNFKAQMTKLKKECNDMIEQAPSNFSKGFEDVRSVSPDIFETERLQFAGYVGYTKTAMVDDVIKIYQDKLSAIKKQDDAFEKLTKEIKEHIKDTVKLDQEMSVQIKSLGL